MDFKELELDENEGYVRAYYVENTLSNLGSILPGDDNDHPAEVISGLNYENFIYLEEIFIYPEFRRQGHALRLMNIFLDQMEDEDCPVILIAGGDFTPKEMDIIKFYEDFGFDILMEFEGKPIMIR